jgi:hypothetical protein
MLRGDAYATLAGLLGNRPNGPKIRKSDAHEQLVPISLKIIDAPALDLKTLIALREREEKESGESLRKLRHRYAEGLENYVARLTNEKSTKADAEEIKRQFENDMRADLRNLKKELGFATREVMFSKEVFVTTVAALGTVASWVCGVPLALPGIVPVGGGAIATIGGLLGTRNKYLKSRQAILKEHPMAYLYEMRH